MGTLQYDTDNRTWIVTASPQVLLVAKRVFAKASKHEFGSLQLSDTLETVQDLDWFMSRYPLQHLSPDYFRKRMVEARIRVRAVEEVIHHQRTQPHLDDLALPLRDYQKVAAQLCLTSGRLLLADDLGTGKTGSSIGVLTGDGTTPCVVVTATHLVHQWQRELERFLATVTSPGGVHRQRRLRPGVQQRSSQVLGSIVRSSGQGVDAVVHGTPQPVGEPALDHPCRHPGRQRLLPTDQPPLL